MTDRKDVVLTPDDQDSLKDALRDLRRRFDLLSQRLDDVDTGLDDLMDNFDLAHWDEPKGRP